MSALPPIEEAFAFINGLSRRYEVQVDWLDESGELGGWSRPAHDLGAAIDVVRYLVFYHPRACGAVRMLTPRREVVYELRRGPAGEVHWSA